MNKQWQVVKADGFEKICGSPWLFCPSGSTGYWQRKRFPSSSSLASLEKARSRRPCWLPQSQDRTGKARSLTFVIPPPNCFCLAAEAQLNARHWYRLTSQVGIWQEPQNHLFACWSQPGTEQAELLVLAVQHCGYSPQTMPTLLLGGASEHVTSDHTRGGYLRVSITKHSSAESRLKHLPSSTDPCWKHQLLLLKALLMKEPSQMLQLCITRPAFANGE